jgi:PAS domain S-box-containing protein
MQGHTTLGFRALIPDEQPRNPAGPQAPDMCASEEAVEERFRFLFGKAVLPMWVYDIETLRFLAVNDVAIAKYGYTRQEFLRMCITDIRPPDEVTFLEKNLRQERLGAQDSGPWRHRLKDHSLIDVQITSLLLSLDERKAALVTARDLSDERRAGFALRQSTERFRLGFEYAAIGMVIADLSGRVLRANPAFAEMLGYSGQELEDVAFADITDPKDQQAARSGVQRLLGGQIPSFNIEKRYCHKSGQTVWAHTTVVLIRDSGGKPLHFVALVKDISKRKDAERALEKRTAYLNALFECNPLAIVATSLDDRVNICNPAFERMFQYESREIAGKVLLDLITPAELRAEALQARYQTGMGQSVHLATRRRRKDGTLVDVAVQALLVTAGTDPVGIYAMYEDITDRKRAESQMRQAREAAEKANRAKSEFLANMSHEIRTPLNGVMGMIELALDTELSTDARDDLGIAKGSADSLLTVINDILDFSKIEAGKFELDDVDFDLREVMEQIIRTFVHRASEKGLKLGLDLCSDLPGVLVGDPARLRQVVVNLLGNALKFTSHGEVRMTVELRSQDTDKAELQFTVADTGIGISRDKQSAIFEAFAQADASTTRKFGGTGLGLTISSRLVQMMRGRLWVESEFGHGSTFCFTAWFRVSNSSRMLFQEAEDSLSSLAAAANTEAADQRLPGEVASEAKRKLNVLVAEDNPVNRQLATRLLEKRGYSVAVVQDGQAALAAIQQECFDLVLMDVQMPEMDGFEATAAIRQSEQGSNKHLPIIAMTAHALRGDRERCLGAGMDAYISKPVKPTDLYDAIETVARPFKRSR